MNCPLGPYIIRRKNENKNKKCSVTVWQGRMGGCAQTFRSSNSQQRREILDPSEEEVNK